VLRELTAQAGDSAATTDLERVHVLAPIPQPRKNVFCLGLNFEEHFLQGERARPTGATMPTVPLFFSKATTSVIGPYDPIPYDARVSQQVDWEAELAVVIGSGGKNLAEDTAMQHVFGYTVLNDVSARDIQWRHGGQFFRGKSLDGYCPIGPLI